MNIIKKILKIMVITVLSLLIFLWILLYIVFNAGPKIINRIACDQYISKNYKNAEIINQRYEHEFPLGKHVTTLRQGNYEFDIESRNNGLDKAVIEDFYGSPKSLSDENLNKIKNFICNHELFKKYNYQESEINIKTENEYGFITKEKADKNTFEIIDVTLDANSESEDILWLNIMTSEEKHEFLNDIYSFFKSENIKCQKLNINFTGGLINKESSYISDITETLTICSNEFLNYEKNKKVNKIENDDDFKEKEKVIFSAIENTNLKGLIVEDVYIDYDINILLKNKENKETLENNIEIFLKSLDDYLQEKNIRNDIVLILKYDSHNNKEHYIHFSR